MAAQNSQVDLAHPPTESMIQGNVLDRITGMLEGLALGDALGAPHEFRGQNPTYTGRLEHRPRVPSRYQGTRHGVVGQYTDDTEMALALADTLVRNPGYDTSAILTQPYETQLVKSLILAYETWANSHPMGMGRNTRALFSGVTTVKGYLGRRNTVFGTSPNGPGMFGAYFPVSSSASASNGSLMRAAPLVVTIRLGQINSYAIAMTDLALSNPNIQNQQAELLYLSAMRLMLDGHTVQQAWQRILDTPQCSPIQASVRS